MGSNNFNKSSNNSSLLSYKSEFTCAFALIVSFTVMTYIIGNLNEIPNKLCTYASNIANVQIFPAKNKNSAEVILSGCIKNGDELDTKPETYELRKGVSIALPFFSMISILLFVLISYCIISKLNGVDDEGFTSNLKDFLGQNKFTELLSNFIWYICNYNRVPIVSWKSLINLVLITLFIVPFILLGIVQNTNNKLNNKLDYDLINMCCTITIFIVFTLYIGMKLRSDSITIYFILFISGLLCVILCFMSINKIIDLKTPPGNLSCVSKENVSKDGDMLYIKNDCIFKDDKDPYNNGRVIFNIMSRIILALCSIFILEFLVAQKLSDEKEKLGIRLLNLVITIIYVVFIILYH